MEDSILCCLRVLRIQILLWGTEKEVATSALDEMHVNDDIGGNYFLDDTYNRWTGQMELIVASRNLMQILNIQWTEMIDGEAVRQMFEAHFKVMDTCELDSEENKKNLEPFITRLFAIGRLHLPTKVNW